MKKTLTTLIFCGMSVFLQSQNASVEKSTYGIQAGFLGFWAHSEIKLSNPIVLRSELGMDMAIFSGSYNSTVGYVMAAAIALEPRWYYNLNKRISESKSIAGNSGNFLTIKIKYNPNWFAISNYDVKVIDQIAIVPTWGIRRNIGNHFTYETGIGIGYRYIFGERVDFFEIKKEGWDLAANLHLRIGYKF